jgi:hypothetical protein
MVLLGSSAEPAAQREGKRNGDRHPAHRTDVYHGTISGLHLSIRAYVVVGGGDHLLLHGDLFSACGMRAFKSHNLVFTTSLE